MINFCTLFDSNYLTRGLALYHSLRENCSSFRLYVYCFDENSYHILTRLALPHLVVVSLTEFESRELLEVKPTRTRGEYCWTCTAHVIRDAIQRFTLNEITYLDADLFFFADPELVMLEFRQSRGSVLITEHRYSGRYDMSSESGIYCVQFMTFISDDRGMKTLNWWCDRTLEWCFNRFEEGRFGDQKYLDDWTERFEGIHVLQHIGGGVAPWNIQRYNVGTGPSINAIPVVFYHFHDFTWLENDTFMLNRYRLTKTVIDQIYRPYISNLKKQLSAVQQLFPEFNNGKTAIPQIRKSIWKTLEHKLKGKFHVIR